MAPPEELNIDERSRARLGYWLIWLVLLFVILGGLILYGRHIIEQAISESNEAQQLTEAQLEHLKKRIDKGQFGSLRVDDITTSYLSIDSAEGRAQFLEDLGLGNLIDAAQNPGLIGDLPANFSSLIGRCPGCVMLQTSVSGPGQLGHVNVAGLGNFGAGLSTSGSIAAGGSINAVGSINTGGSINALGSLNVGGQVNAASNVIVAGLLGVGTGTPKTQLDVAGSVPNTHVSTIGTAAYPLAVRIRDKYAYITSFIDNKLQIFDMTNPAAPTLVSTTNTGINPADVQVQGRYAYVSNLSDNTIQVYDVSNPRIPVSVATVNTGTYPAGLALQGRYLYVVTYGSYNLEVFDIGNPAAPKAVGSVPTFATGPLQIRIKGVYAYVTTQGGTLEIFNISNPASPTLVSYVITTGSQPNGLALGGRYAYMLNNATNDMTVVDISDPAVPTIVRTVATGAAPLAAEVSGRYLYVTSSSHFIEVFDISDPSNPVGVAGIGEGGTSAGIASDGRYVYVTDHNYNKLYSYDVGGAALQQFTAGRGEVGSLALDNLDVTNEASFAGGLSVSRGFASYGGSAFYGQTRIYSGSTTEVNQIIQASLGQTADLLQAQDSTGAILAKIDAGGNLTVKNAVINGTLTVNGHIITGGSVPTIAAEAAAGIGATVSISGNDTLGTITITTGAAPVAGDLASITFAAAFGAVPKVILTPANVSASTLEYFQGLVTTSTFKMACSTAPAPNTTYIFNYWVGQ